MKLIMRLLMFSLLTGAILFLCSCQMGNLVSTGKQRVTFALVIDTRVYNGKMVYADVLDDPGGTLIEAITAAFESYPATENHAWTKMTTLNEIETNRRYFLDFFIDIDNDGTETSGDLTGIQHFEVMPSAVWSETKYFTSDLEPVP